MEELSKVIDFLKSLIAKGVDPGLLIAAVVALCIAAIAFKWPGLLFGKREDYEKQLEDEKDRAMLRRELESGRNWREGYRLSLERLLGLADKFYGPDELTFPAQWRAFNRCLVVAYLYPILLFMIGWLGGGSGRLGASEASIQILPEGEEWKRIFLGFALVTAPLCLFYIFYRNVPQRVQDWVESRFASRAGWPRSSTGLAADFVSGAVAVAVAVTVAVTGAGAVAVVGAVAGADVRIGVIAAAAAGAGAGVGVGVGASASASASAGVGVVTVVVVVVMAVTVADIGFSVRNSYILLIFLVFLPIVNAIFDWLSLQATRWLLARAAKEEPTRAAGVSRLWPLALDLLIALACLSGLAFLTGFLLEAANAILASVGGTPVHWLANLAAATHSTFGDSFLFVGMLMTTLVPTAIHLVLGLLAIITHDSARAREMASLIRKNMSVGEKQRVAGYIAARNAHRAVGVFLALVLSALVVAGLFRIGVGTRGPDGREAAHPVTNWLVRVTLCGAAVINGSGCPISRPPLWPEAPPKPKPPPPVTKA